MDENQSRDRVWEVAEAIDKLVINPAAMKHWRSRVISCLEAVREHEERSGNPNNSPWPFEPFRVIEPEKDRDALYLILALCHDDMLRINPILTSEIKAINSQMCTYPNICAYMVRGVERLLPIYLRYVTKDLNKRNIIKTKTLPKLSAEAKEYHETGELHRVADVDKDLITLLVAVEDYQTTRRTIRRAIKKKHLTSYRPKNAPKNAPHLVSRTQVRNRWPPKK